MDTHPKMKNLTSFTHTQVVANVTESHVYHDLMVDIYITIILKGLLLITLYINYK